MRCLRVPPCPSAAQVAIAAAFPEVELLPTALAEAIPAESNPALLR